MTNIDTNTINEFQNIDALLDSMFDNAVVEPDNSAPAQSFELDNRNKYDFSDITDPGEFAELVL